MTEENNIQEATLVEEPPVEKPATRIVDGLTIPNTDAITDEEILVYIESLKSLTNIELMHQLKLFRNDKATVLKYKEMFESAKVTFESFAEMKNSFGFIDNDLVTMNEDKMEKAIEEEDPDFDGIEKELKDYEDRIDIGLMAIERRYNEVRESGIVSIRDDIVQTLSKNLDTVKKSSDINKDYTIKFLEKTIDEFNSAPDGIVDQYTRISRKLENPKRNLELVKYVKNHEFEARKKYINVGFTDEIYNAFLKFLKIEDAYYAYCTDGDETAIRLPKDIGEYVDVYFYHISKIVDTESRKKNYLSLIYKCNILQVIELGSIEPDYFRNTVDSHDNRLHAEPDSELDKISKKRQRLYKECVKIFSKYPV